MCGLLLRLRGLVDRFTTSIPKINDIDDISFNAIDHLVKTIDDDAAVGQRAVFHFIFIPLQAALLHGTRRVAVPPPLHPR